MLDSSLRTSAAWRVLDGFGGSMRSLSRWVSPATVEELLTLVLGPNALLVAARIDLSDKVDADRIERTATDIDEHIREVVPDVTEVFLDPTPARGRKVSA